MSHLLDDEDDDLRSPRDRELTLSTSAILGIFFGLVLLCGLFFAFGYNMGSHKSAPPSDSDSSSNPNPTTNFSAFKPAAGSPASTPSTSNAVVYPAAPTTSSNQSSSTDSVTPRTSTTTPPPAPVTRTTTPAEHVTPPSVASVAPSTTGTFMVQVAAVSHQEDADLLVSALKGRGYAVAARQNPSDQLIHIQVGPFNNRKDADAMRMRLLNDGYNAILK